MGLALEERKYNTEMSYFCTLGIWYCILRTTGTYARGGVGIRKQGTNNQLLPFRGLPKEKDLNDSSHFHQNTPSAPETLCSKRYKSWRPRGAVRKEKMYWPWHTSDMCGQYIVKPPVCPRYPLSMTDIGLSTYLFVEEWNDAVLYGVSPWFTKNNKINWDPLADKWCVPKVVISCCSFLMNQSVVMIMVGKTY